MQVLVENKFWNKNRQSNYDHARQNQDPDQSLFQKEPLFPLLLSLMILNYILIMIESQKLNKLRREKERKASMLSLNVKDVFQKLNPKNLNHCLPLKPAIDIQSQLESLRVFNQKNQHRLQVTILFLYPISILFKAPRLTERMSRPRQKKQRRTRNPLKQNVRGEETYTETRTNIGNTSICK